MMMSKMYFKTSEGQKCFKHLLKEVNQLKALMTEYGCRHTTLEEFLLLCLKNEIKKRFDKVEFIPVCLSSVSSDPEIFRQYLKILIEDGKIELLENIINWVNEVLVRIKDFEVKYLEKI